MSVRRLAEAQPEAFAFTPENAEWARGQIAKYPEGRQASAVIPILWRAQKQHGGWLPEPAIAHVADMLAMARIRVLEIATFYTMFNLQPVGRHHVQLCGTTPCWLRGADDLKSVCRRLIGEEGHVTGDGALSWIEVECLGACCNAPMVQINDDCYEDLTANSLERILADLGAGREARPGSRAGRVSSEPAGGITTLTEAGLFDLWKTRAKPGLEQPAKEPEPPASPAPAPASASAPTGAGAAAPVLHAAPPAEGADDLKRISGVGPKLEAMLHALGIWRFDQIALWTPENVAWVDARLSFKGRIARDDWIAQAVELAKKGRG
jgi:NADH-quinone oxidoreductase subunit E